MGRLRTGLAVHASRLTRPDAVRVFESVFEGLASVECVVLQGLKDLAFLAL